VKTRFPAVLVFLVALINLSSCIAAFSQDQSTDIESLLKAIHKAQRPAENMRFKFVAEQKVEAVVASPPTGTDSSKSPLVYNLIDYTITISGNHSRIEKIYKSNNASDNIARTIEVYDGNSVKVLRYRPSGAPLGMQKSVKENYSRAYTALYGCPLDITSNYIKYIYSYRLLSSEDSNIYILEAISDSKLIYRIYIDSNKNNNIVKWQMVREDNTVVYEINHDFTQTDDGIWYPSGYQKVSTPFLPSGEQAGSFVENTVKIVSAEFNINIPKETFHLKFPDNAEIRYSSESSYDTTDAPSLLNKSLPEMKDIGTSLSQVSIEDKNILVCFFDYQQRPSRNCMIQLSKRAEELKSKDIEIIAVHTSKIEQEKLDEWVKENDISFSVGKIQENEEDTRFTWGVKSLPWLILTDTDHLVTAEGFGIVELNSKVKAFGED